MSPFIFSTRNLQRRKGPWADETEDSGSSFEESECPIAREANVESSSTQRPTICSSQFTWDLDNPWRRILLSHMFAHMFLLPWNNLEESGTGHKVRSLFPFERASVVHFLEKAYVAMSWQTLGTTFSLMNLCMLWDQILRPYYVLYLAKNVHFGGQIGQWSILQAQLWP